jgi:acid phosphatase (class A)
MLLSLGAGLISQLYAEDGASAKVAKTYLAEGEIDLIQFLPPAPANDSAVTKAEIQELLNWQAQRTPDQIAFAQADANITVFRFADILGPSFTAERLPFLNKFFQDCVVNVGTLTNAAKAYYHRTRPYLLDTNIHPVVDKPTNASYPSGHSTAGHFFAILLANMVPEKATELYARGDSFAFNRIIGGVHYATDIEAGKLSATLIAARMFTSTEFDKDFLKARSELRKVLGLPETK